MDLSLLQEKGLAPSKPVTAYVDGFGLRIGDRATLVKSENERAYGLVMTLTDQELLSLYGESSVADYVPETIEVSDLNNGTATATVYNLPPALLSGRNKAYARSLAGVAKKVGLPDEYIKQIESWAQ